MGRAKHIGIWQCPNCQKEFKHKKSLNNHKQKCGSVILVCEKCSKVFTRKSYLKIHTRSCQFKNKNITDCQACTKRFPTPWHLKRHKDTMHTKQKVTYTCEGCNQNYARENHYLSHVNKCEKKTKKEHIKETRNPTLDKPIEYEVDIPKFLDLVDLSLMEDYFSLGNDNSAISMADIECSEMDSSHIDSIEVVEDSEPTSSLMPRFKKMVSHCLTLYFV